MSLRLFCSYSLAISILLIEAVFVQKPPQIALSVPGVRLESQPNPQGDITGSNSSQPDSPGKIYIPIVISSEIAAKAPRVNVPYFNGEVNFGETAIFWFGKVNPSDNYADVRVGYNSQELWVHVAIFDRRLWYDGAPSPTTLTAWDATSLFVNLNGNIGNSPGDKAYRFDGELNWWENRADYQASYRGNGSGWSLASIPFSTETGWISLNMPGDDNDDRGWIITYHIPFASLGLSGPPQPGVLWGIGLQLHDRDSENGPPLVDTPWPKTFNPNQPASWGQLSFGIPTYTPPPSSPGGTIIIRNKLNGAVVTDAHVGGGMLCGEAFNPNFFNGWGDANYAGVTQVNVQDQANLGDWPCFSKFYITFPLTQIPAGKVIRSAKLTLYQFGNSNPAGAYDSLIQALVVKEDWNEATITWNNAPYAWENIGQTWVNPLPGFPGLPGVANEWDVTRAVAEAYQQGSPLRLVFYDADFPIDSGKYFYSSDVDDGMPTSRPTLTVDWGN
jgi:hypothetical protein